MFWTVYRYQLACLRLSIVGPLMIVFTLAFVAGGLSPSFVASGAERYALGLQLLLWVAWIVQGLVIPYWAATAASHVFEGGLLEWWLAAGASPGLVVAGQLAAILTAICGYLLVLVTPIMWMALPHQSALEWRLLGEHHLFYMASSLLLGLWTFLLASRLEASTSFVASTGLWGLSIAGSEVIAELLNKLNSGEGTSPTLLFQVLSSLWHGLPRFELFFRPTALLYLWPPLSLNTLFDIVLYTAAYVGFLWGCCHWVYRPRF